MKIQVFAPVLLHKDGKRIALLRSIKLATTLAFFLFATSGRTLSDEMKPSTADALFAADEDVLSENTDDVLRHAPNLSGDQQFDFLANWVLPSATRTAFRMKATFAQTDPPPPGDTAPVGSTIEGICTPVFLLIAVAQQTDCLDELRRRVAAIDDPSEPHGLRAKHAMLFMIDSASGNPESAATSLAALSALVRTRSENLDGRWWPETLALAYGMQHAANRSDMQDLATSIYDPQIGHSIWSGHVEWDLFIAACFAKLQPEEKQTTATSSTNDNDYEGWIPASASTAESRGKGHPESNWKRQGDTVSKVGGHNGDFLYLPVPLTGNFEIMCDVTRRASDEKEDRIVSITDNTDAPIRTVRVTLHTGGAGRESSVRLKRLEIYASH